MHYSSSKNFAARTAFVWAAFFTSLGMAVQGSPQTTRDGDLDAKLESPRIQQTVGQRVLTAEDFKTNRVNRGSGLEEVTWTIQIHPKLRPYVFRLIPDSAAAEPRAGRRHIGRIEVSHQGSSSIHQTIEVRSYADVSWLTKSFEAKDVNFDGYLDFAVIDDFGEKWRSYSYRVFDKASGLFITSRLTEDLSKLRSNTFELNRKSETINVTYAITGAGVIGETYKIKNGHLFLVGLEKRQKNKAGNWEIVTKKLVGKRMKVTKTQKEQ